MEKKSKQTKLIPVKAEVVEPEEETQEIAPVQSVQIQQDQNNQIDMLISKAIDRNVSIETMERLLAMRKELRAEKAKEAFDADMASFQGECPTIKKTKAGAKTKSGIVAYHYAPIESIVEQVKVLISKHGFSYAIKTETGEGKVKAICFVKHRMGHSESSETEVPLGIKTDIMSNSQHYAAAMTFAKRYAFTNAFGIMTGDDDNDAAKTGKEQTPASSGVGKRPTTEQMIASIRKTKDRKTLESWQKQIPGSNLYTETQKRVFLRAINDQMGVC